MYVESFYNLFCCEGKNNIGAIIGEDYWMRGCCIWFCFYGWMIIAHLWLRNDPAGRKAWFIRRRENWRSKILERVRKDGIQNLESQKKWENCCLMIKNRKKISYNIDLCALLSQHSYTKYFPLSQHTCSLEK